MDISGINVIIPLNVPVSDGADGGATDVSGVVGLKSVELSGVFEGTYTILGSHNGVNYVPLVVFQGGGDFKQTIAFSPHMSAQAGGPFNEPMGIIARFVKVRRRSPDGGVVIVVGAGSAIAVNQFVALATIAAGAAAGPMAAVDLFALVLPTGFFQGFSAFCDGGFSGNIVLEGSLNGANFAPLGAFAKGGSATLGPSPPVVIDQIVRYIRVDVKAAVTETTVVTLGGATATNVEIEGGGGSIDDAIKARVKVLTGMRQFSYWSDPFMQIGGRAGSPWTDTNAVDLFQVNSSPGGVMQVASNAGFGGARLDPAASYPFAAFANASSFFGLVSAAQDIYMFFRFRVRPDPGTGGPGGWDAPTCSFIFGLVDATTLRVAGVGVAIGSGGVGGFFQVVGGNVTNAASTLGTNTATPFDFDVWHNAELFTLAGSWWLKIDDGVAQDVSAMFTGVGLDHGLPFLQAMSTGVLQPAIDLDHCAYAAPSNMPPMSTSPTPPT